jgi:hypothetical protein
MKRTSNNQARQLVETGQEFNGNNTYARYTSDNCYVVYSYGSHFPMYIRFDGIWYGNDDKYSVSTSRHQSQLRPSHVHKYVDTNEMQEIIRKAYDREPVSC